jgi:DNA-binding NarL/FixJ family response regulator
VGYLLKDRVADVTEFTDAVSRIAAGGTALDREVVSQLLAASRHAGDLDAPPRPGRAEQIPVLWLWSAVRRGLLACAFSSG